VGWDPRLMTPTGPWSNELGPGAVFEGPFGDHTGFYSMPDRYPILEVTAITHRRDPIYPTTIVGLPPQEDYFLGKATERLFLPLLKTIIPDIEDYDLPLFGAFHNCAFVKIKKQYPLQARRVMHSVWGAGQMAWTKTVFVVDDDTDVHDAGAVMRTAAENCLPSRDIERVNGPLDILDHAAPRLGAGMKAGFDCTRKVEGEDLDGKPLAWLWKSPGSVRPRTRGWPDGSSSASRSESGYAGLTSDGSLRESSRRLLAAHATLWSSAPASRLKSWTKPFFIGSPTATHRATGNCAKKLSCATPPRNRRATAPRRGPSVLGRRSSGCRRRSSGL
jgi:3-polyprenyl-4-hydroxybenzoate decarboxylase